jgi:hypothetical protein
VRPLAYVLILLGLFMMSRAAKGRTVREIPGDIRDIIIAAVTNDSAGVSAVLSRTTEPPTVSTVPRATGTGDKTASGSVARAAGSGDKASRNAGYGGKFPSAGSDAANIVALGVALRNLGYRVSQGPGPFGPITRVHTANSYHYRNRALDVNWTPVNDEPAKLDVIADDLVSAGYRVIWRTTGHYNHLHVDNGKPAGRVKL